MFSPDLSTKAREMSVSHVRLKETLRNGINLVHSATQESVANVVFIHGLFGHPWKTWAADPGKSETFWPLDLLPWSISNVNIFSFGYDADVQRFMSTAGLNTVHQHGRNLLNGLCDVAGEDGQNHIPFFFIVHSLGGLVLKEALNQSSNTDDRRKRRVVESTSGIIFLGTPHRGSSVASYGRMAFIWTKVFASQSANTKLLQALERDSETLDRINTSFLETLSRHRNLRLFSFFEERETRKLFIGHRIVPPECARIGHDREDWGGIPEDHRRMAKYSSATDPGFVSVVRVLKRWVKEIVVTETVLSPDLQNAHEECLKSLDNYDARARIQQVAQRHRDSFEWLFGNKVPFVDWLTDDSGRFSPVFWITGKPGSGKSTLMRFAMQDVRTLQHLPGRTGEPIGYFFHHRGKSLVQKSLQGMLQELVYQILVQFPDLFSEIHALYLAVRRQSPAHQSQWGLDILRKCFVLLCKSICGCPQRRRLVLFIDALDENFDPSENRTLLDTITEAAETAERRATGSQNVAGLLKICLASRPWPTFVNALGKDPRIPSFEIHNFTKADIAAFTKTMLLSAPITLDLQQERLLEDLAATVTERAQGVFIWVRVVVEYLSRNIADGTSYGALVDYVWALPQELQDLYEYTMRRINPEYALETMVSCKILLASLSKVSLLSLHCATQLCIWGRGNSESERQDQLLAWLSSRTGGLVEVIQGDAEADLSVTDGNPPATSPHVGFIHQTFQEYVRKGMPGLPFDHNQTSETDFWPKLTGSLLIYRAIVATSPFPSAIQVFGSQFFYYLSIINQELDRESEYGASLLRKGPLKGGMPREHEKNLPPPIDSSIEHQLYPYKAQNSRFVISDPSEILKGSLKYGLPRWVVDVWYPYMDGAQIETFHAILNAIMLQISSQDWGYTYASTLNTIILIIMYRLYHVPLPIHPDKKGPQLVVSAFLAAWELLPGVSPSLGVADTGALLPGLDHIRITEKLVSAYNGHLTFAHPPSADDNQFETMFGKIRVQGHLSIPGEIKTISRVFSAGLFLAWTMMLLEDHLTLSHDQRLQLFEIMISRSLPDRNRNFEYTLEYGLVSMIPETFPRVWVDFLDYCVRFKSTRWAECLLPRLLDETLLEEYSWVDSLAITNATGQLSSLTKQALQAEALDHARPAIGAVIGSLAAASWSFPESPKSCLEIRRAKP